MAKVRTKFTWTNYLIRLAAALVLVFATYNPSEWSFFHWVLPATLDFAKANVFMAMAGIVLLIAWIIFLRATERSLGRIGMLLAVAFFGILIWVVVTYVPSLKDNLKIMIWLILIGMAGVLSAGISWSHIRRRMTGQMDVDHEG
jgi:hypothetical protein